MQTRTQQLTLGEVSDRLDRLPMSRFHAKILIVAALSLLFDTLDTAVTGFVLASLRTAGISMRRRLASSRPSGCPAISWALPFVGLVPIISVRKKTILFTLILYSVFSAAEGCLTRSAYLPS